ASIFRIHFKDEEGSLLESAKEVKLAIAKIKQLTGSPEVNVVTFSAGSSAALAYFVGIWDPENKQVVEEYADDIHELILTAPPLQGSPLARFVIDDLIPDSDFIQSLNQKLAVLSPDKREQITIYSGSSPSALQHKLFSYVILGKDDGIIYFPKFPGGGVKINDVAVGHGGCREDAETLGKIAEFLTDFE
ncbi:unnamed protein product, partial [marine sediment metagenome]